MAKVFVIILLTTLNFVFVNTLFATEEKKASATVSAPAKMSTSKEMSAVKTKKANIAIMSGTILKIDTLNPQETRLEVKNDKDGTTYTMTAIPSTKVRKVADISEIKTGDMVRIISKKVDDKNIALGLVFGKIKIQPKEPKPSAETGAQAISTQTSLTIKPGQEKDKKE